MNLRTLTGVLASIFITGLLTGCNEEGNSLQASSKPAEPLFVLSADGVGPLNGEIPFNLIRIGHAFQDFNVAEEVQFAEGDKRSVITVKQKVTPLLSINPDSRKTGIFSIIVHDNLVGNQFGHRLGDKFNEIYAHDKVEECAPGMEEWAGKVMCYAPQTENVLYLFEGNGESAADADGEAPPPEVMANWTLGALVWKPPRK